ncbi:MAG: GNAT family N-acetyltransferase [Acidobacteria bacterium]|jgi:aminoglycoside 6'-N-acetyltransferase I|nr:GNAT family N-acetyltransferase [Acidobacteriota bacterium]
MTVKNFRIRRLQKKDLSEWFRLRKLLWDESTDEEHKVEMVDIYEHTDLQLVLVAETEDESIIGFLEASIRPFVEDCHTDHVGYLEGWFVEPEYRRNGIGQKLVEQAEKWARSRGCEEMASDSEIDNDSSSGAHQKLGYTETSRLVHWRKDLN